MTASVDTLKELEARVHDLEVTAQRTGQNLDAAITPLR
ncbi:acetyl-CoA carboxylase carboxyl transferase subunit alpha, partial [Deinococcus sp. 12RED42]|nr:acetyl-CoA carboxylase carboxyl transferase subunit alpha [Deinococcus sp. 12RED42]